jgi:hypothetical protein
LVFQARLAALTLASGPALAQVPQDVEIRVRELPEVPVEPQAVPGEVIVKKRPGVAPQSVLPAAILVPQMESGGDRRSGRAWRLSAIAGVGEIELAVQRLYRERAVLALVPDAFWGVLLARIEVQYAQPNLRMRPYRAEAREEG